MLNLLKKVLFVFIVLMIAGSNAPNLLSNDLSGASAFAEEKSESKNQTLYKTVKIDGQDIFYREAGPKVSSPRKAVHLLSYKFSYIFSNELI